MLLRTTGTVTSLIAPLLTVAAVQQWLPTEDPLAVSYMSTPLTPLTAEQNWLTNLNCVGTDILTGKNEVKWWTPVCILSAQRHASTHPLGTLSNHPSRAPVESTHSKLGRERCSFFCFWKALKKNPNKPNTTHRQISHYVYLRDKQQTGPADPAMLIF